MKLEMLLLQPWMFLLLLSVQYAVRFRHCPGTGILRGLVCMEVQAVNGCKPPT